MAVWLLSLVFSGCLAFPEVSPFQHPGQYQQHQIVSKGNSRIVGGEDASTSIRTYPWQASLMSNGIHICGAVILKEDFILTAAQCVDNNPSLYLVRVGSAYRTSGGTVHKVSAWTKHEKFQNFKYDVAVLKLSSPILFNSDQQPIELTSVTNDDLADYSEKDCVITGWGLTNEHSLADHLQMAYVKVLTDAECTSYIHGQFLNGDIHICILGKNSTSCHGDSGGPLACRVNGVFELAGVQSFVLSDCPTNFPSVYAETYMLRTWIQTAMDSM